MTSELPPEGSRADALLLAARAHYAEISAALRDGLSALREGDDKQLTAFSQAVNAYWKAIQSSYEREVDLEKRNRERAGIARAYALDLDAARAEIGRRLACLKERG